MFFGYSRYEQLFKVNRYGSHFQDAPGTNFHALTTGVALVTVNTDEVSPRGVLVTVMYDQEALRSFS